MRYLDHDRAHVVYLVAYVEDTDHLFLKTAIPSRKATRDYLGTTQEDEGERHDQA